jgi:uncharacterized membrane protein
MEETIPKQQQLKDSFKRSLVKSIGYRFIIVTLDFITVYIFTGKVNIAVGFMLVSNAYTTLIYFLHERMWTRIKWGKQVRG